MLGMFFFYPPRASAKRGGILAKIPTYGNHLSHNVYYGGDYGHCKSVSYCFY